MVADIEKMMAVNVTALMVITRLFTPGMIERKKGHVINIGSIAGYETWHFCQSTINIYII